MGALTQVIEQIQHVTQQCNQVQAATHDSLTRARTAHALLSDALGRVY